MTAVAIKSSSETLDSGPSDWREVKLEEVCEKPQYGYTESANEKPVGPKFLRITDIQDGRVNWATVPHCKCSKDNFSKYRLLGRDLVIARIGATTGKAFYIGECPDAVFASYLIRVRTKEGILSEFLNQFTNTDLYWSQINESKGGRLKQGVNIPVLTSLKIPLPPLPEQKKIATVLSALQEAKEKTENVLSSLKELKKSMMKQLFTYGAVPIEGIGSVKLKETEIGLMPESWVVRKVDEVAKVVSGGTPSREKPSYWNGDIPWVKTGEIDYSEIMRTEEMITREGLDNSSARIAPKGTLLMAMYGQGITRGRVAILGIDASLNQACAAFILTDKVDAKYLYHYFAYSYSRIRELGHGANQKNLSAEIIKSIFIPVPSLTEQQAVIDALSGVDGKIAAEENKKNSLDALFKTLLSLLMTGKIRVKDLEI